MSYQENELQEETTKMNNTTKWILGLVGALLLGGTLIVAGIFIGRGLAFQQTADNGFYGMMGGPGISRPRPISSR